MKASCLGLALIFLLCALAVADNKPDGAILRFGMFPLAPSVLCTPVCAMATLGSGAITTAQPVHLRGQLRRPDNRPVPAGIPVVLIHQAGDVVAQTSTDSTGKFEFTQIQAAVYRVIVHAKGYLDLQSNDVNLLLTSTASLNLQLRPDPAYKNPAVTGVPGGVVSVESLLAPDAARNDLQAGEALLEEGADYDKSIKYFKSAIKAYPKYSEAYLMMGLAFRAQSKDSEAEAAFRKCLELNGSSSPAYAALGEIQNRKNDFAGAEQSLLKALALNPEAPEAHEELARTYWAVGRWQDADPHVTKALSLDSNRPRAHVIGGNIELRKHNAHAALHHFQEYLRLEPKGALAAGVQGVIKKIEKALAEARPQ